MTVRGDLYISADVEADGPVPGLYSMLSFGLAVAGGFDGKRFQRSDPTTATFYRELRPITHRFEPEYAAASRLDQKAGAVMDLVVKRRMPAQVLPERRHTHHALDDALEQAELFANLFTWAGKGLPRETPRHSQSS